MLTSADNSLLSFVEDIGAIDSSRIGEYLGQGFVRLTIEEAERRQAIHDIRSNEDVIIELLRNSRDAEAQTIFVATWTSESLRHFVVIDDGTGIPSAMIERVFEPRVTSKLNSAHIDRWGVHGRGMALYSIEVNSEEAFVCCSRPGIGTSISVKTSSEHVSEKADQSTYPELMLSDDKKLSMKGPRNIVRTCAEFALEQRKSIKVYLGSPAEIVATMAASLDSPDMTLPGIEKEKLWSDIALCDSADELVMHANTLGLDFSQRTAYRIFQGEIAPLAPLADLLLAGLLEEADEAEETTESEPSEKPQRARLAIAPEDMDRFSASIQDSFQPLAEAYYLNSNIEPVIRIRDGKLTITFDISES